MKNSYQKLIYTLFLLTVVTFLQAQTSSGGQPMSFSTTFQSKYRKAFAKSETVKLPKFDLEKALLEDQTFPGTRVAAPIAVDLGLENAGKWYELANGDRIWRMKVQSSGAYGLMFLYDQLYLPPGAQLFMYQEDGAQILGAYTFENNTPNHTFMTGFVYSETAILEYYEPQSVRGEGRLHLFRIDHAYKKSVATEKTIQNEFGFGASDACNRNANCPEGSSWQDQKRGICRIIVVVEEGTGFCTGSLLNNAEADGTPYVLSAYHCQDGFTPKYDFWRYDFNYEASSCNTPGQEPTFQSVLGSTLRAGYQQNDILLLELAQAIPTSFNVYFNGWDRKLAVPTSSFSFHHPRGDIKKISVDNGLAIIHPSSFQWQNANGMLVSTTPANFMYRLKFEIGTVEAGSSGTPLFDQNGRIVGQLHGGTDLGDCNFTTAYYDRFALSWEGGGTPETRLKDWLDPMGRDTMLINGINQPADDMVSITGFVRTASGMGVSGVNVSLVGPGSRTTVTDTSGAYIFQNLQSGAVYGVSLVKDLGDRNGISIPDILLMSQHILGVQPLDTPLKILAADVDESKSIAILDLITLRKLILGIDVVLPQTTSWKFLPEGFQFSNPLRPWDDFLPTVFQMPPLTNSVSDFNFTAIKMGDIDLSANPQN